MTTEFEQLSVRLEALGESEVRIRLAHPAFGEREVPYVQEWLRRKEEARASVAAARRDAREEETLNIAKEANSIARDATKWAKWAVTIATLAAVIAARKEILKFIFG